VCGKGEAKKADDALEVGLITESQIGKKLLSQRREETREGKE